jgi:hypothetical protein
VHLELGVVPEQVGRLIEELDPEGHVVEYMRRFRETKDAGLINLRRLR